jgi:hypothetical protein
MTDKDEIVLPHSASTTALTIQSIGWKQIKKLFKELQISLKVTIRLTHLIKFLCFEGIGYLIRNV